MLRLQGAVAHPSAEENPLIGGQAQVIQYPVEVGDRGIARQ
jgi:hypothetical protein